MNMKKMLALLLALVMVFALAACGESGSNNKEDDTKATAANQEKEPAGDTNEDPEKNPEPSKDTATVPSEDAPVTEDPDVDEPVVDEPVQGNPVERPMPGVTDTPSAITEFVNGEQGKVFMDGFAEGFESTGLTCTSTIEATGTGFVVTICINELDNVSEEEKADMQAAYDEMAPLMGESLTMMQAEVEGLTYFCVNVCDKDGDFLASLYVGE
ncbi:MAG: hypothetical protein IJB11_04845 [Oscillospiraceae bacterium]|nr:hypothetical protein [Oscillospiraceae bacterium]